MSSKWNQLKVEHYSKTTPPSCEACGYAEGLIVVPMGGRLKELGRTKAGLDYIRAVEDEGFPPWGVVLRSVHHKLCSSGALFAYFPHIRPPD